MSNEIDRKLLELIRAGISEEEGQRIVALIKASFNLKNKSLGKLAEDLAISFSAAKIISDHAQPQVTERWIIKKAEETAADYPDVAFPNLITIFKGLLTEAGVIVKNNV